MKGSLLSLALGLSLLLTACARSAAARPSTSGSVPAATVSGSSRPIIGPTTRPPALQQLARVDQQGMVAIEVIPTNLDNAVNTLDFGVAMNTHSVDLSMDLASLSTLTTDTGLAVQASKWEAPPGGGHHVIGTLIFPAAVDGKPILVGAHTLTLTILNVDAPLRTFEWLLAE